MDGPLSFFFMKQSYSFFYEINIFVFQSPEELERMIQERMAMLQAEEEKAKQEQEALRQKDDRQRQHQLQQQQQQHQQQQQQKQGRLEQNKMEVEFSQRHQVQFEEPGKKKSQITTKSYDPSLKIPSGAIFKWYSPNLPKFLPLLYVETLNFVKCISILQLGKTD